MLKLMRVATRADEIFVRAAIGPQEPPAPAAMRRLTSVWSADPDSGRLVCAWRVIPPEED
jgi:hypothetical protein